MRNVGVMIVLLAAACDAPTEQPVGSDIQLGTPCDWPQIFGTSDHAGRACPELHGLSVVKRIVQDPDAEAEIAFNGFLQVHESPVVTFGDWVIVPTKDGYTDSFNQQTVRYHVAAYRWTPSVTAPNAELVSAWTADTDFATVDANVGPFLMTNGYVQQFAIAVANGSVYVPAAHAQILRLSLTTGALQARIDPFAGSPIDGDDRLIFNNAPMVTPDGTVYYTATAWPTGPSPFGQTPRGSWLVKVLPTNDPAVADWSPDSAIRLGGTGIASLPGIPRLADLCEYAFGTSGTPRATGPTSRPPLFRCGAQRPALNAPIAYSAASGHLVGYSYANNARGVAFLVEIDPTTLTPIRAADLRDNHLLYGCGVRLDIPTFPGCDAVTAHGTTNIGVDPDFNGTQHLRTPADIMDNAPTISPDGALWTVGSYDGGFSFEGAFDPPAGYDARGAMVAFHAADGSFAGNNPEFGWEVTASWLPIFGTAIPSVRSTFPVGYDVLQDRGLYSLGHLGTARYGSDFELKSVGEVPNQLFGDFVNTHITFGAAGDHYGIAESGFFYKLDGNSNLIENVQLTDGPVLVLSGHTARDRAGRAYVTYAGSVHIIASSSATPISVAPRRPRSTVISGAKFAATMRVADPGPPTD